MKRLQILVMLIEDLPILKKQLNKMLKKNERIYGKKKAKFITLDFLTAGCAGEMYSLSEAVCPRFPLL
jgi:hypothetical protein